MARGVAFEDQEVAFEAMIRPLVADGVLAPIADRDADARLWMDSDLCSFVENRCHHRMEPTSVTPGDRETWTRRALAADDRLWDPRRSQYTAAFWLLDHGVRAGTLALSKPMAMYRLLPVSSLSVFPAHRGTGVAYRALRAVDRAVVAAGLSGIRVGTYWTWQTAVRRYLLRYGMWAWSFKRSIDFIWADLPPHRIAIDEHGARFAIEHGGRHIELLTAARDGELLIWNEAREMASDELSATTRFHARSTLALALAVHGWPLLRAGETAQAAAGCDVGGPQVLAYKIGVFEALDRRSGFDVRTPRIPGLPYAAIERLLEG